MQRILLPLAVLTALGAGSAVIQSVSAETAAGAAKLSPSECTNLWQQANKDKAAGLTQAQAQPYVADFKAANPDSDTTIDQNEWMAACNKGLVKSASSTGSSSTGASGGEAGKTSDRTPGDASPARTPNASDKGAAGTDAGKTSGGTSDRTPSKN